MVGGPETALDASLVLAAAAAGSSFPFSVLGLGVSALQHIPNEIGHSHEQVPAD